MSNKVAEDEIGFLPENQSNWRSKSHTIPANAARVCIENQQSSMPSEIYLAGEFIWRTSSCTPAATTPRSIEPDHTSRLRARAATAPDAGADASEVAART